MERLRIKHLDSVPPMEACRRCGAGGRQWDRVADKPLCPNCQEALVLGEAPALRDRADKSPCAVCARRVTVKFLTQPLNSDLPVEMSLCGEHLSSLLARKLGPYAFIQIRRQLRALSLATDDIFLLHGEFYDQHGHALRPAVSAE